MRLAFAAPCPRAHTRFRGRLISKQACGYPCRPASHFAPYRVKVCFLHSHTAVQHAMRELGELCSTPIPACTYSWMFGTLHARRVTLRRLWQLEFQALAGLGVGWHDDGEADAILYMVDLAPWASALRHHHFPLPCRWLLIDRTQRATAHHPRLRARGWRSCPRSATPRLRHSEPPLPIQSARQGGRYHAWMGRLRVGRLRVGRLWMGRLWMGRLRMGRLWMGRLRVGRLWMGRLWMGRLRVGRLWMGRLWMGISRQSGWCRARLPVGGLLGCHVDKTTAAFLGCAPREVSRDQRPVARVLVRMQLVCELGEACVATLWAIPRDGAPVRLNKRIWRHLVALTTSLSPIREQWQPRRACRTQQGDAGWRRRGEAQLSP